ncbi:hypothetical protein ACF3NW_07485 [Eikenella halliae]|uniref:hypothetical protein n=1 Tax=Eikenella halliae TaxID=1795832 RepID=UPI00370D3710
MCAAGAHAVVRYAKLPVLFPSRVRAFCTHPAWLQWKGYLKPPEHLCLPGKKSFGLPETLRFILPV